jgi:hypothetical protein
MSMHHLLLHDHFAAVRPGVLWWREQSDGDVLSLAALQSVPVTPMVAEALRGIPTKITKQSINQNTTARQNPRRGVVGFAEAAVVAGVLGGVVVSPGEENLVLCEYWSNIALNSAEWARVLGVVSDVGSGLHRCCGRND